MEKRILTIIFSALLLVFLIACGSTIETKTVTFDLDYDNLKSNVLVNINTTATTPIEPTRAGYAFDYWYLEDINTSFDFNTVITQDITLKAKWTPNTNTKYTVVHYRKEYKYGDYSEFEREELNATSGENITPSEKNYTGYSVTDQINSGTIKGDGSTVLNIYYARDSYEVTFDFNGGQGYITSGSVYFNDTIPPELIENDPIRDDYKFLYWVYAGTDTRFDENERATGPISLQAKWESLANSSYTVKHFKQNINDDGYSEFIDDRQTIPANSGTTTAAQAKSYTGFNTNAFTQTTVEENNSTVINIYYDRKEYNITFNTNGGTSIRSKTVRYGYILNRSHLNPTKPNKVLKHWYTTDENIEFNFSTPITGDITLNVLWEDPIMVTYFVHHHIDKSSGPDKIEIETFQGIHGETTNIVAKNYIGHTARDFEQITLNKDNSNKIIHIYYDFSTYTVTFDCSALGETWTNQTVIHGNSLQNQFPTFRKTGYRVGWYYISPLTNREQTIDKYDQIIYENLNIYAKLIPEPVNYRVRYLFQSLDDDNVFVKNDSNPDVYRNGLSGSKTVANGPQVMGFEQLEIQQLDISGEGTTVVDVKYIRKTYDITFVLDEDDRNQDIIKQVKYEGKVTPPTPLVKDGFTFKHWHRLTWTNGFDFDTAINYEYELYPRYEANS